MTTTVANGNGKTESFVAHTKFIIDGIERQAGTLQKAMLEGGMNGLEAGSERVDFSFDECGVGRGEGHKAVRDAMILKDGEPVLDADGEPTWSYTYEPGAKLVISDQGRGFQSRTQINEWFRTFGTPHEESEGKKWAEFRMGRGQMFSFGHNVWRTGEFRIVFDLKTPPAGRDYPAENILDYHIEEGLPIHKGCEITITLYENPIGGFSHPSVGAMKSKVKKHMEFMEGVITFNGEQINTPASKCKWDFETDDAYFMFNKGSDLSIYNMGAFVFDMSASDAGVTGVVVSKDKLKVNFARNSIMHDCEIWKQIQEVIRANKVKKIRRARRSLARHERMSMLTDLRDGAGTYGEAAGLGLIPLTNEGFMSLRDVCKIRQPWAFSGQGDQRADALMVRKAAVVFDEDIMLELDYPFDADPQDFFVWLMEEVSNGSGNVRSKWEPMRRLYKKFTVSDGSGAAGLADGLSTAKTIVPQDEWTKVERRIIKTLTRYGHQWKSRTLMIGQSETALAWTDGRTYIALDRLYIKRLAKGKFRQYNACHLVATMLHETAHDDSTVESHHHNLGFYKLFHDIVSGTDGTCESPMGIALVLPDLFYQFEREEDQLAKVTKEKKQKAARDKQLGLTAGPHPVTGIVLPLKKSVAASAPKVVKRKVKVAKAVVIDPVTGRPRKLRRS